MQNKDQTSIPIHKTLSSANLCSSKKGNKVPNLLHQEGQISPIPLSLLVIATNLGVFMPASVLFKC